METDRRAWAVITAAQCYNKILQMSNNMATRDFTLNDIHIGSCLYSALIHHALATRAAPIVYSDLLALARGMHPDDAELVRAVPVGMGNKLLFVEAFCQENEYPNLACLAVGKATGRPGPGYKGDWERDKREVGAFDWSVVKPRLDAFVSSARAAATPRKARSEDDAKVLRYKHYDQHRAIYDAMSDDDRQEVLNLLMAGVPDAASALSEVLVANAGLDAFC